MTRTEEELSDQMIALIELYTNKDWGALVLALEDAKGTAQQLKEET